MSYNNKASRDDIKENVENFLNFHIEETEDNNKKPGQPSLQIEADTRGGLVQAIVETTRGETYVVQACPICGETQPGNFKAFKKAEPEMAEQLLREKRKSQAERYVKTGSKPVDDDVLKSRVENEVAQWDNNRCETRHPPREPELKL